MNPVFMYPHKNSQKRYYPENAIYFITTRTKGGHPYFNNKLIADLLVREIFIVKEMKKFQLFGLVIIPDHVHLMIQPTGKYNVSNVMFSIKKNFAHEANRLLGYNRKKPAPTHASGQTFARLREYVNTRKMKGRRFVWQSSFHDHVIRDENDFETHLDYLRYNPIKHGLIKDGKVCPYLYINDKSIHEII